MVCLHSSFPVQWFWEFWLEFEDNNYIKNKRETMEGSFMEDPPYRKIVLNFTGIMDNKRKNGNG